MAHLQKFTRGSVKAILEHDTRTAQHDYKNPDIDPKRTHENYSFIHDNRTAIERLEQRLSEVKVQNRKDVNVLCSWVITKPFDVSEEREEVFFKECYRFLTEKYGSRNVITADVHYDESTPHLHFTFVPTVANTRKYKDPNKKPRYTEKVCADELITREHLKTFHSELQKWFIDKGMEWAKSVSTGTTTYNKSIAELKQRTEDYCNEMVVKAKQAKEKAESDAQKLVNKQIDILHSMETYEPRSITAHQLPLGMVAVKKKDFMEIYQSASASVGLKETWKKIQESENGQQVEKLQKELEEERAKNAENARIEQEKQKRYSEVLSKAENTLKMQKNTIEQLKKENEELREKFELVKKVVLDMWDHVSEYFKSQLERIGIRKSRGYHR